MAAEVHLVGNTTPENQYLRCYFEAKGLHPGDVWSPLDYMLWIDAHHNQFHADHGIPYRKMYNEDEGRLFLKYLKRVAQDELLQQNDSDKAQDNKN